MAVRLPERVPVIAADDLIREELSMIEQLERMGLDRARATTLVDLKVNWHDVDELAAAGCDPVLASCIAAPAEADTTGLHDIFSAP